ncbi:MAG TPA: TIR domain-containing protein, partial [Armatimonadota bacterium]|nr:TIR domain-containing protein [Armatimonadota bacterium]
MSVYGQSQSWQDILKNLVAKRKVFVSYHHGNDQYWYDRFSGLFSDTYDIVYNKSLERRIDSDDPAYVDRRIRENYIVGTSITIVLCGAETWKRKYVDWEIYATLYCEHALLGICLPTALDTGNGKRAPDRFVENWKTGYAHWMHWSEDPIIL